MWLDVIGFRVGLLREQAATLAGVVFFDDVPIARGFVAGRQAEDGFERDVPVEATVVSEDEFIEVGVDVFADCAT